MSSSPRHQALASVPSACRAACAVLHDRDGHVVVGHYGSIAGEIAVCATSVGLADHSDYGVFELRGDRQLLDRELSASFGARAPVTGSGRRLRSVWYLRIDACRALLVGPHAALAAGSAIGRDPGGGAPPQRDIGASLAIVGILGPRATRLLVAAGLPGALAVGAVGADAGDSSIVAIVRESQRRYLALVRADAADAVWARLLTAGEALGAAFVGSDALTLLNVSDVVETKRPATAR